MRPAPPQPPEFSPAWHRHAEGALSQLEWRALADLAESAGFSRILHPSPIDGPRGFVAPGGRDKWRAAVDEPGLAEALTGRLSHLWGGPSGRVNERLRFYAYDPGQRFPPHTDGHHAAEGERSLLTLLLYLSDGFEGGETVLHDPELCIRPRAGAALLFPHQRWHEGRPVRSGRKLVLRTDVVFPA